MLEQRGQAERQQQRFGACEIPALLAAPCAVKHTENAAQTWMEWPRAALRLLEGVFLSQCLAVRSGLPSPRPLATAQPDKSIKRREEGEEHQGT